LDAHLREILDLIVRWVHVIAGIMWIGNSLLFNWLDRNLEKVPGKGPLHEGEIWLLHSGGFYQVEKKQLAPSEMPRVLHWFKWQNFTTWASGISLLIVVYYMGGASLLVDPSIKALHPHAAIGIGLASVVGSWIVYDGIWRSPLRNVPAVAATLSLGALFAVAFGLTHVLSGRGAFIHVGVILGTVMTGNVWMVIVPSQRELVAATEQGRDQDKAIGMRAKQRSIHNNYMTFPLLFIMVSNHFPSVYGARASWAALFVLMFASAGVRHFMNVRWTYRAWFPAASALCVFGVVGLYLLTARPAPRPSSSSDARVTFAEARAIVTSRCTTCHSTSPTDDVWKAPPSGIILETPAQMKLLAGRIKERAVVTRTMPLGNKTGITDAERDTLGRWVDQGAAIELRGLPADDNRSSPRAIETASAAHARAASVQPSRRAVPFMRASFGSSTSRSSSTTARIRSGGIHVRMSRGRPLWMIVAQSRSTSSRSCRPVSRRARYVVSTSRATCATCFAL